MKGILIATASLATLALSAADYTWVEDATNWKSPSSYRDSAGVVQTELPTSIDTLSFTKAQTLLVDDESIAFVSAIGNLKVVTDFVLDVYISGDARLDCKMDHGDNKLVGTLRKRGAGSLQLGDKKGEWDYAVDLDVQAGVLHLPGKTAAYSNMTFGRMTVAKDAVLFISSPGNSRPTQLAGEGLITNVVGQGVTQLMPQYKGYSPTSFAGRLCGDFQVFCPGVQYFTGTQNTMANQFGSFRAYGLDGNGNSGTLGFTKLGNKGEPSSVGNFDTIDFTDQGAGRFIYLGEGEVANRGVRVQAKNTFSMPHMFDAGVHGGLEIGGPWTLLSASMARLILTGNNEKPCTLSGAMNVYTDRETNYTCYVTKQGTGAWHFACPSNDLRGPIAVQNGTLLFDSVYEKGELSSLGRSSELWADAYGLQKTPVNYAFILGSAATVGTMETAGEKGVVSGTRPYVLTGKGGRLTANTAVYKASGISATTPTTLYLAGTNTSPENVAAKISGSISVVKEGTGTWTLDNELSFTGDLAVNSGTLIVRNSSAKPFTWFRWTVKETAASCSRYKPLISENKALHLREIVLMGADGKRQLLDAMRNDNRADIAPGEIGYGRLPYPTSGSQHLEKAFVSTGVNSMNVALDKTPVLNDPTTWVPMIMRLTNGAPEIVSFDVRQQWGWDGNGGNGDQYCYRTPTAYMLEGSCDGMNWTELLSDDAVDITGSGAYISTHTDTSKPIALTTPAREKTLNVLSNIGAVSVASGATLKAEGAEMTISKLKVDATSAGTLEGFALAGDCQLDVENLSGGSQIVLPGEFVNVSGLQNVSGWSLSIAGGPSNAYKINVKNGKLTLSKSGLILILR